MKKMKTMAGAALALAAAAGIPAAAYEVTLHRQITTRAVAQAVAEDDFRARLGLRSFERFGQVFNFTNFGRRFKPGDWIANGSVYEDDFIGPTIFPPRSAMHFFDPQNGGAGLNQGQYPSSRVWALDATNNPLYSIPQARDSFYKALTTTDDIVREHFWADTFRAVGQFTHLVQDTAQPQHVRDDVHLSFSEELSRALPSLFPRWSRYESFTALLTPGGGYPTVKLPKYEDYWATTDRRGLADYTSYNFVSEQTNFDTPTGHPSPAAPIDPLSFPEETIAQVLDIDQSTVVATNVPVRFVSNLAVDNYAPGQTVTNPRLSAFSIFDFQHFQVKSQHVYSLYNDNHQAYFDLLTPRAIGYSAGLIEHFFRGSLKISAPADVVFGIIDPMQTNGFQKIKLRVANTTPNEGLSGGNLKAIARFHTNDCYRNDLSGEEGGPNASDIIACRSDFEGLVVSQPRQIDLPAGGAPVELSFDFGQTPIPVNATDLYLEVVYRGSLGNETDAVAFGTLDLFEPTHIAFMNGTDVSDINDTFYLFDDVMKGIATGDPTFKAVDINQDKLYTVPPDADIRPFDMSNIPISFAGNFTNVVANIATLPSGRFVRMTVLTDRETLDFFPGVNHFHPPAAFNQVSDDGTTFFVTSVSKFRGFLAADADILLYCVDGTTCNGDLSTIKQSNNPDTLTPLGVTVTMQFP